LFSFFLSLLLLPLFVEIFLIPAKISAAIVILLCVVISYLGHKQFSFRYR
jgi:putative flippase GtrA